MLTLVALAAVAPQVILGGQKQIIYGLKPEPTTLLSYFVWVEEKPNEYGSSTNVYAQRLGYTGARVREDIFNSERVFLFETDGRTKKDFKKEFDIGVGASEKCWIDPATGHILKQVFTVEMPKTGERIVEAIYGTKTVELSIKENGKERALTLYPEEGCQPFFDRFKPMIVDGNTVIREKKFAILDPYSLSYVWGSALPGSRFDGPIMTHRMKGNLFHLTINGQKQRVYVTDKQELVKIDVGEDTYFQVDALPPSMQLGGGGG